MGRPERCGGCDDAGKICANCGMCVACAVESLNEGEGYCTICVGDVLAHVQSQIARLEASPVYVVHDYDHVAYAGTDLEAAKGFVKGSGRVEVWINGSRDWKQAPTP